VFELNPNYCDWRHGHCLVLLGKPEEGLAAIRRHMRLDPFYPPHALMTEGLAYFVQRKHAAALPPFREMVNRAATFRNGRLLLAATFAHLGHERQAKEQVEALLRIEPDCSLSKLSRQRYFQNADDGANMFEGLRKAGIPNA
jgi:adenylate cyclase